MRWTLIGLLTLHGLIHLMGFAKAFGYAELPQLMQPISREWGVVWLLAAGIALTTIPSMVAYWTHSLMVCKGMFCIFIPA